MGRRKQGRPRVVEGESTSLQATVSTELVSRLDAYSRARGMSRSAAVRTLLEFALGQGDEAPNPMQVDLLEQLIEACQANPYLRNKLYLTLKGTWNDD